jgi:glyceraldehyde-3-phosphate dehydrogenase (NAD(P))
MMREKIRVAVNGFGVIGRRVADAVLLQEDMELVGVADVTFDARVRVAAGNKTDLYSSNESAPLTTLGDGPQLKGGISALLKISDVMVDCTPKGIGAKNAPRYCGSQVKFIVQGGEKHEVTGHSFVAELNYEQALGRNSTRVVSCNTTSIVRTLTALKQSGLLKSARGVLLRRATDPWKSHEKGILNTLVPEEKIPSHQGPDAQTVDSSLDVVTMAVMVPETLGHLHYWSVQLSRAVDKQEN